MSQRTGRSVLTIPFGKPFGAVLALAALAVLAATTGSSTPVQAASGGITGFSGNPATQAGFSCEACHSGGVVPNVILNGPTTVEAGSTSTYTLTIASGDVLNQDWAGFDVSATDGLLIATQAGTREGTNNLGQVEITHEDPVEADFSGRVTFQFDWTAPLSAGSVTLYGAGNSVNLNMNFSGDAPGNDALVIAVEGAAATPGESSGPGLQQLRVVDYDPMTGDLSLTYENGCEATENTIHFGPLDAVSTHAWSGSDCAIGTSGAYTQFNPGAGSYFFVVVAHDGSTEGSYGRVAPADTERPDYPANVCGQLQDLSETCAVP
jgi:hypothetical protein